LPPGPLKGEIAARNLRGVSCISVEEGFFEIIQGVGDVIFLKEDGKQWAISW
jgi:hypothetical protein